VNWNPLAKSPSWPSFDLGGIAPILETNPFDNKPYRVYAFG